MGRAKIDTTNKLSPEDIEVLKALHIKVNREGTMPAFGEPNQETWVIRDISNNQPVGFIHLETLVEVRAMVTDPDYEHKKMALTIGQEAMETVLRRFGHGHYYITVPKEHEHVLRFYEGEGGGVRVDTKSIRYRKEL